MPGSSKVPITLLLHGGGPLGVAFQAGALICLEDLFSDGFRPHVRSMIGSSAGAVTGAFLSIGLTPQLIVKSMSGAYPDEIEYFDPSILLQFDRGRVPNPFRALWRSLIFLLSELRRGSDPKLSVAARKKRYDRYLDSVDEMINLVPKGWFTLTGLEAFLRRVLAGRNGQLFRFDQLRTNLFICATDLTHGRAVLFGKSKYSDKVANTPFFSKHQYVTEQTLVHAILCSTAIPFLFIPQWDGHATLADGDARNTAAVGVAKSLVGARFMIAINPLVPLARVGQQSSTSEMFLQAILTSLEGNIVANLKMEFEEKYHREIEGRQSFDVLYFRPSPERMQTMTGGSVVRLFRYHPGIVATGYCSVFETVRDHLEETVEIVERYGYELDLKTAERRYALMSRYENEPAKLEETLLHPKNAVPT